MLLSANTFWKKKKNMKRGEIIEGEETLVGATFVLPMKRSRWKKGRVECLSPHGTVVAETQLGLRSPDTAVLFTKPCCSQQKARAPPSVRTTGLLSAGRPERLDVRSSVPPL